jgi:hypothetical protein
MIGLHASNRNINNFCKLLHHFLHTLTTNLPTNTIPSEHDKTVHSDLLTLLTADYNTYLANYDVENAVPNCFTFWHLFTTDSTGIHHTCKNIL